MRLQHYQCLILGCRLSRAEYVSRTQAQKVIQKLWECIETRKSYNDPHLWTHACTLVTVEAT